VELRDYPEIRRRRNRTEAQGGAKAEPWVRNTRAVRSERAVDVNRSLHERWAGRALLQDSQAQRLQHLSMTRRSSEYVLGGIQAPAAPSERSPTLITTQGSASAPPWAFDVRYAFGVFSDAPPNNDSTVIHRFLTLNTCEGLGYWSLTASRSKAGAEEPASAGGDARATMWDGRPRPSSQGLEGIRNVQTPVTASRSARRIWSMSLSRHFSRSREKCARSADPAAAGSGLTAKAFAPASCFPSSLRRVTFSQIEKFVRRSG
jgi:hypothetical protein